MAFSYTAGSGVARDDLRFAITDTSASAYLFEDAELDRQLLLAGNVVALAAAELLEIIASKEALVSKRIQILDLKTDGPAVAASLREHAARLRAGLAASAAPAVSSVTARGW